MKAVKIIGGILLAGGIAALIYLGVSSKTKKVTEKKPDATPGPQPSPSPTTPTSPTPAPKESGSFPLTVGMMNNGDVKKMQMALIDKFPVVISAGPTGNFGPQTVAALKVAGYVAPISKDEYKNILAGKKKGEENVDPNALKSGDMVKMKEDATIYTGVGFGMIGTIPKGKAARYLGAAVTGWVKIRTIDYYTDYYSDENKKYVFKSQDAYLRSYLIQKV